MKTNCSFFCKSAVCLTNIYTYLRCDHGNVRVTLIFVSLWLINSHSSYINVTIVECFICRDYVSDVSTAYLL